MSGAFSLNESFENFDNSMEANSNNRRSIAKQHQIISQQYLML